jgi:hypothetical protein
MDRLDAANRWSQKPRRKCEERLRVAGGFKYPHR